MKQTKIVASISDRRCDQDFIRKLFFAGMNVVRMNTAHATEEGIRTIVKNVRAVSPHIGIMIDTKGPEVRTTGVKEPIPVSYTHLSTRMGAMGWSYGGYMMNWLQGHTKRFKCLASMMGVYDLRSMWGSTCLLYTSLAF